MFWVLFIVIRKFTTIEREMFRVKRNINNCFWSVLGKREEYKSEIYTLTQCCLRVVLKIFSWVLMAWDRSLAACCRVRLAAWLESAERAYQKTNMVRYSFQQVQSGQKATSDSTSQMMQPNWELNVSLLLFLHPFLFRHLKSNEMIQNIQRQNHSLHWEIDRKQGIATNKSLKSLMTFCTML